VQVTLVVVAAVTAQVIPSIMIVYLVVSVAKLVPENVIDVPPVTGPYLGSTVVRRGVRLPW